MKFCVLRLLVVSAIFASVLVACKPAEPTKAGEVIRPVKTVTVEQTSGSVDATYAADIRPRIESRMAFRVGGKVVERLVELGSTVRKDQPLMRLDPADLQLAANAAQAQVAAAKANDDVAQAALKRSQDLAKQNFISQGALDLAIGQATSARATLDAARANGALGLNAIQYSVLRADSDGVITSLDAEVGQVVAAGTPVVRIAAGAAKDVVFNVPEAALGAVKRGAIVQVKLWSAPNAPVTAVVRDVSAMADPVTRTFAIKASLKDGAAAAPLGASATASLTARAVPQAVTSASNTVASVAIPLSAVIEASGKTAVWVVEGGLVKKRVVTLGSQLPSSGSDAQVLATSGLALGAVVVVAGVHTLAEGQKVKLLSANQPAAAASAKP
jgi:membrane fusion protein, multidrug efflux system